MARGTPDSGIVAEFEGPRELQDALRALRRAGYRRFDTFGPYALEDEPPDDRESPARALPVAGFVAGVIGGALAFAIQWFANGWDYPLDVGGRPLFSAPAWVPITFEMTVLFASGALFFGICGWTRLPRLWHPIFEVEGFERATVDRFWIAVASDDPIYHPLETADALRREGALRITYIRKDP